MAASQTHPENISGINHQVIINFLCVKIVTFEDSATADSDLRFHFLLDGKEVTVSA